MAANGATLSNEQRYYRDISWMDMASSDHQGYGIKCDPDERTENRPFAEYFQTHSFPSSANRLQTEQSRNQEQSTPSPYSHSELTLEPTLGQLTQPQVHAEQQLDLPVSDMDLNNLLDMDDKTLTELAGGASTDWNSLFNGQLDCFDAPAPDPMTGIQNSSPGMQNGGLGMGLNSPTANTMAMAGGASPTLPGMDGRWLLEEAQKLERQQKLQQQKLFELQQTLLKTEILKNQLQIASTISQNPTSVLSPAGGAAANVLNGLAANAGGNLSFTTPFSDPPSNGANHNSPKMPAQHTVQPTKINLVAVANSGASKGGMMSSRTTGTANDRNNPNSRASNNTTNRAMADAKPVKPKLAPSPTSPPSSKYSPSSTPGPIASFNSFEDMDGGDGDVCEPDKRKVHNLIEKKYRCSINDRICLLRDMVSKHSKDNKRLQKSAVLQKTIDYIRHLENVIKRLTEENEQLKEALANGKSRMPSYSSPPATPHTSTISPQSGHDSEGGDSGNPSSPDDFLSDASRETSPPGLLQPTAMEDSMSSQMTLLTSQLLQSTAPHHHSNFSQFLMVITLVAIFFVNPLTFIPGVGRGGAGGPLSAHSAGGSMRTLNTMDSPSMVVAADSGYFGSMDIVLYVGFWILRILMAAVCFGWMTLKSMPKVFANSNDAVRFWRFRKQAENDLMKGEYVGARDNLEVALAVISRPIPTSYYGIVTGLLWSLFSHVLFQLVIGQWAVALASLFVRNKNTKAVSGGKKQGFGVTFADVSQTYHLLHQINMASTGATHLHGMGFYLGLNALNFAEADRPFHRLSQQELAEMFFTLGLQCHFSIPYGSSFPMWYYFFCFRNVSPNKYATPLKWAVTPPGKKFLMSAEWATDVKLGSKLYVGAASLPLYSVTRAYCKQLLCETFTALLLPDSLPEEQMSSDFALQAFKQTLNLAKEANTTLFDAQSGGKLLRTAAEFSDSGFSVIQWWASVGIVACYWSAGEDSHAEDYYSCIEALSGDGAAVPSTLQLAFKANVMHKRPSESLQAPLDVILQLCAATSNSLKSCVTDLLQDNTSSTETELHQLGLLLACDWLLSLRMTLWEKYGKEEGFTQETCPGFYQDVEALSKLVKLLPSAVSRLRLYKGCYQLIAGANPMAAQAMLSSTGRASFLRRRANSKDSLKYENPALYSHEHAMAKLVAYKHLPPSLEPDDYTPPSTPSTPRTPATPTIEQRPTTV